MSTETRIRRPPAFRLRPALSGRRSANGVFKVRLRTLRQRTEQELVCSECEMPNRKSCGDAADPGNRSCVKMGHGESLCGSSTKRKPELTVSDGRKCVCSCRMKKKKLSLILCDARKGQNTLSYTAGSISIRTVTALVISPVYTPD